MAANVFEEYLNPISKYEEISAYEALWDKEAPSFKQLSAIVNKHPGQLFSELVMENIRGEYKSRLTQIFKKYNLSSFGIAIHAIDEFPKKLRDARYPVELLYYQGCWDLIASECISVVGTRNPSTGGIKRAQKLVKYLVEDNFTIVSGLARGIDTVAHQTAIECGGKTIGVIGTPLSHYYPKENELLQKEIARNYLLVSQVPFCRYEYSNIQTNRFFFPERNITMSALSKGTIIVEASETSGTLYQARAALSQNRKLFILDSCFKDPNLTWPKQFEKKGAIRVVDYQDIQAALKCLGS